MLRSILNGMIIDFVIVVTIDADIESDLFVFIHHFLNLTDMQYHAGSNILFIYGIHSRIHGKKLGILKQ